MTEITKYNLLDTPTEGLDSEGTLREYVKNTDYIVGRLDGTIPPDGLVYRVDNDKLSSSGKVEFNKVNARELDIPQKPDAVVWLDKSARPVSWFVKELWSQLVTKNPDGSIPERPQSVFLNIDRIPWLMASGISQGEIDPEVPNQFDINNIGTDNDSVRRQLGKIRGLFIDTQRTQGDEVIHLTEDNFDEEVWKMPLKGRSKVSKDGVYRHLMIVDEVKSSGATLGIAQQLISAALPELVVTGAHWQPDKSARSSVAKNGWAPVWYSEATDAGRGVGDINLRWYNASDRNWRQKLGASVLSTAYRDRITGERMIDRKGQALREDIKELAKALFRKEVLYKPARQRSKVDTLERIHRISGLTFDEWRVKNGTHRNVNSREKNTRNITPSKDALTVY